MARPLRIEYPGAVYHITTRGNARKMIFKDADDRKTFLEVLGRVVKKYNWLCHAYCLMDNHFHLIVETPEGNLSRSMRQLNGMYTQAYNRQHKSVGHIFQGRFKAILVEKESYLLELCRYVVLNPVRAGTVERPAEWKWSSYKATAGISKQLSLLTVDWILGQFGDNIGQSVRRYKEFIVAGLKEKSPWKDLKGQLLLGEEGFLSKFKELLANKESISEIPKYQRYLGRPALSALFAGKDMLKRNKMMHQGHVKYGYTLKEIGDYLGIHYTTVSKAVRALEE